MKKKTWLKILFTIYLLLLVWLVIFKLNFPFSEIQSIRRVNLNPFYYITAIPRGFSLIELIANILIFIPFGFFLIRLKGRLTIFTKVMIIILTSISFEVIQYVFAVGVSDITDVLANTIGGILGIIIALLYGLGDKK